MRLWSIHPKYLDRAGLIAVWREALLAKKVLQSRTKGYKHHPQLERFKNHSSPIAAINTYLHYIWKEGKKKGYRFDGRKLGRERTGEKIKVKKGQLDYELNHLRRKLGKRDKIKLIELSKIGKPDAHPLFTARKGGREKWEKV